MGKTFRREKEWLDLPSPLKYNKHQEKQFRHKKELSRQTRRGRHETHPENGETENEIWEWPSYK